VNGHASPVTPDLVAAWATGAGVGLIAMMIGWLIGNRLVGLIVGPPTGPTIAFIASIVVGVAVAIRWGRRLAASVQESS